MVKNKLGLTVSCFPHIHSRQNSRQIMLDVIIALLPSLAAAAWLLDVRALLVTAVSVGTCVAAEWLYCVALRRPVMVGDCSAVITGMLLAFCMRVSAPLWMPFVGALIAILLVKQPFGGLGNNFLNPALTGCMAVVNIRRLLPQPEAAAQAAIDALSGATPLTRMGAGLPPNEGVLEMLLSKAGGSIGEASSLLLILGGVYLVARDVIKPRIPLAFLGTVALLTFLFPNYGTGIVCAMYHLLGGGLLLGAIFFATDYASSPVTPGGQWMYGVGCGVLTVLLRYFGSGGEGITYAILLMDLCARWLDRIGGPRRYGVQNRG